MIIMIDWLPAFIVGSIAVVYALFLFLYQKRLDKKNGITEKQKKSKELQKQMMDLSKDNSPESMNKVKELQQEMMTLSTDMMKGQFKSMLWIMLIGLLVLYVVNLFEFAKFPITHFWYFTNALTWFILISLLCNIIYKLLFWILEKKNIIKVN